MAKTNQTKKIKYYEGLRLAEQTIDIDQTIAYVNRLKTQAVEAELILA